MIGPLFLNTAARIGPQFWVNNPSGFGGRVTFQVHLPEFLVRRGWGYEFINPGGASFTLPARGTREVLLRLKPGAEFTASDVNSAGSAARIVVQTLVNRIPVGGMTYVIDPRLKVPPRELPDKPRRERCEEEAEELLECLGVPFDDVKAVRIKRLTLDVDLRETATRSPRARSAGEP